MEIVCTTGASLESAVRQSGYAFVHGAAMGDILAPFGGVADRPQFEAGWTDRALAPYRADGGRYRRRRHATYPASATPVERAPHQPHFQALDYNPLNGGLARGFEPIAADVGAGPSMRA